MRRLAVLLVLGLLVVAVTMLIRGGDRTINVTFTSAEGLYVGDDVRVLGVPVGTISEITPVETGVEVEFSPSRTTSRSPPTPGQRSSRPALSAVGSSRLEPVYAGGPQLQDGAEIGIDRTAVPVTFDDVKQQLTDLTGVLGPRSGTERGALSRAVVALDESLKAGNSTEPSACHRGTADRCRGPVGPEVRPLRHRREPRHLHPSPGTQRPSRSRVRPRSRRRRRCPRAQPACADHGAARSRWDVADHARFPRRQREGHIDRGPPSEPALCRPSRPLQRGGGIAAHRHQRAHQPGQHRRGIRAQGTRHPQCAGQPPAACCAARSSEPEAPPLSAAR
ncbi:MCE family protein [Nocardioides sp. W3-2-3]|nr:MCE family protein [Nocardioides convexus]